MSELTYPTGRETALRAAPTEGGKAPLVLVLGSSGYIGGRLTPRLLEAGYRVRVLSRSPERTASFPWGGRCQVVEGDAGDSEAVNSAMAGVDVVYHLVHSMGAGKDFEAQDRKVADVVAGAAGAQGVGRIIYLSGLHPEDVDLSPHLRSRVEVGETFLRSTVPALVLQAGVVIGSGSASFEMIRHLTDVLPAMPAPRWVRNRIQPIAVRDVLHYLLGAARVSGNPNRSVDIGGPDLLTYAEMMNGYAAEAGLPKRAIVALPVLTPRLASLWVNLVTPVPRSIARPLVASLQNDCVMRNRDVDEIIAPPDGGLTSYPDAVRLALGRLEADVVETSWQDAAVFGAPSDPLPSDPEWSGRTVFTDSRELHTSAPAERLWSVIAGIGGVNGWYSPPLLWAVRGWLDRVSGGVGLRRGRRSRGSVRVGDAIDFWRVEAAESDESGSLLRLRAEMRVPGAAWLELKTVPEPDGARYVQRAIFFPRGLSGRLYWFAVLPFHGLVFAGMAARITAAAEDERK